MGNLSFSFFGFLSFALLARSFSKEIFGEWVLYITSASFVEMFRFGLTRTAVIRFVSGAKGKEREQLIGSNWVIGLVMSGLIATILILCYMAFSVSINNAGYSLFFKWYPILVFLNLPYSNVISIMQAEQKFGRIIIIKALNSGSFFLFILLNYFFFHYNISIIVFAHLGTNFLASLVCIGNGWDGIKYLLKATNKATKTILNFGKFTTFTLIGTNLLKSADAFIISLSSLGTSAVALYSIPLKLTEIMQVPLRSFVATAFPKMSKASIENKTGLVKNLFYTYSGALTLMFLPMIVLALFFSKELILILGGEEYISSSIPYGGSSIIIFKIFLLYMLLLPIDRLTGVSLDSLNMPKKNSYKIIIMVMANIIGDLIAVFVFKSLVLVAVVTVIFTLIGVLVGFYYLHKAIKLNPVKIFSEGFYFYLNAFKQLKKNLSG